MTVDDEGPWYRTLLVGVAAMLGVALLVGGLVGLVALGAVSLSGIGEPSDDVSAEPSLYIPERTGGPRDEDEAETLEDLTGEKQERADKGSGRPGPKKQRRPRRQGPAISLSASPSSVSPMERIDLTGTYPRGQGATLQVQRFEGGWVDFADVTAVVRGRTFSTYVMTGRPGVSRFRVVDRSNGEASNPVRVRVR